MKIGGCFSSAGYPLKADLYITVRTSSASGQIVRMRKFWKTVNCAVISFSSTSFKAQGTNETFGEVYEKMNYITLKTKESLGRNVQVTNIRNDDQVIFREVELKESPATWFNANGSAPKIDPFGAIMEYETLLNRAEQQAEKV